MLIEIFDKFAPASGEISFLEACRARIRENSVTAFSVRVTRTKKNERSRVLIRRLSPRRGADKLSRALNHSIGR